jgi:uncharacterized metal-binding protein
VSETGTEELKVGVISCSGEELVEGTVSRLATRRVLETLEAGRTVTLCLPLFLAGGEGERAFARVHPTIAVDGCGKRCAARATALYSAKPATEVVVTEIANGRCGPVGSRRRLSAEGQRLVGLVAEEIAARVEDLLGARAASESESGEAESSGIAADGCACQSSGIPVGAIRIGEETVNVVALGPILDLVRRAAGPEVDDAWRRRELLRQVMIHNQVPPEQETAYTQALWEVYSRGRSSGRVAGSALGRE